jgi:hypothetical protein
MPFPRRTRTAIITASLVALAGFLAYSYIQYRKSDLRNTGIVTCAEGQCYWTAHMHAWIRISACGKRINLPKLMGPLSGPHTHTEENFLHWHDKLPADPATKEVLNDTPLRLGHGLATLGITLPDTCTDSADATTKFFVNGKERNDLAEYVWRDRDIIDILIDARSLEEAAQDIQTLPKDFPTLGEG